MSSPPTATSSFHPRLLRPFKPTTMSMSQTFRLAHQARGKLSYEASQQDHDLRLLVGHANLLDQLMLHLASSEHQQQQWIEDSAHQNSYIDDREEDAADEEDQDPVYGSLATDWPSDSSSDCDDDDSEDDDEFYSSHPNFSRVHVKEIYNISEEEEHEFSDTPTDDEDGLYSLTRTSSHRGGPPSLCSDLSEDEDDEHSLPPSPPTLSIHTPPPPPSLQLHKKPASVPPMHTGFFDDPHE